MSTLTFADLRTMRQSNAISMRDFTRLVRLLAETDAEAQAYVNACKFTRLAKSPEKHENAPMHQRRSRRLVDSKRRHIECEQSYQQTLLTPSAVHYERVLTRVSKSAEKRLVAIFTRDIRRCFESL
jgi:hypothetical protein